LIIERFISFQRNYCEQIRNSSQSRQFNRGIDDAWNDLIFDANAFVRYSAALLRAIRPLEHRRELHLVAESQSH
jgi:hypothetical protein